MTTLACMEAEILPERSATASLDVRRSHPHKAPVSLDPERMWNKVGRWLRRERRSDRERAFRRQFPLPADVAAASASTSKPRRGPEAAARRASSGSWRAASWSAA